MERNETIQRIRKALKARSGKTWSVTGGRGTSWGWITIEAPPRRMVDGETSDTERRELAELLGLPNVHCQGVSIPASHDHWREYIDRAEGRTPSKIAEAYWD